MEKNKLIKNLEKKSKEKDSHDYGGGYIGEALLSNE
jgi:hypothetical protein